jgi:hypothetical protein
MLSALGISCIGGLLADQLSVALRDEDDLPKDESWIDSGQIEAGLVILDKGPSCLLCHRLGCAVPYESNGMSDDHLPMSSTRTMRLPSIHTLLLDSRLALGVPISFRSSLGRLGLRSVDCSNRRGDDHTLDARLARLQNRLQDACGAVYSGLD